MFYFNMRNAIATLCQQFEMEEPVIVETSRFHVDCREIILISAHHLIYSKNKKHNKTALIHTVNTQTGQTQLKTFYTMLLAADFEHPILKCIT